MIFNMVAGGKAGVRLEMLALAGGGELPAVGETGQIYVQTETALSETCYIQPLEPTGAFESGDVWVQTKETSPLTMNLAKEGSIVVGLSAAYVRVGAAWVKSSFYVWDGSVWVDAAAAGYLIANGLLNVAFDVRGATIKQENGVLNMKAKSGESGWYRTTEAIDLTNFRTLKGKVADTGVFDSYIAVWTPSQTEKPSSANRAKMGHVMSTVTLDVSGLTGEYTVGVFGNNATGSGKIFDISIYDLWLE